VTSITWPEEIRPETPARTDSRPNRRRMPSKDSALAAAAGASGERAFSDTAGSIPGGGKLPLRTPCEPLLDVEIGFARLAKAIRTEKSGSHGVFKQFSLRNRFYTACLSDFRVEIGFARLV